MEIKIRSEETNDIEQVREVLCAAFPTELERKLVDILRANGKAIISLISNYTNLATRKDKTAGGFDDGILQFR